MSDMEDDGDTGYGAAPEPKRIRWEMVYNDGRKEMIFEEELALAALLMAEQVFINDHWWREDWPEVARKATSLNVGCNDVFAWGCADSEEMSHADIEAVYDHWQKDPSWGTAVWCMIKRKQMPQNPVQKLMEDGGKWDLAQLMAEHGMRANHYDGVSSVMSRMKYAAYAAWADRLEKPIMPYDARWWDGWKEYTDANPGWNSEEWKVREDAAIASWKSENGWEVEARMS